MQRSLAARAAQRSERAGCSRQLSVHQAEATRVPSWSDASQRPAEWTTKADVEEPGEAWQQLSRPSGSEPFSTSVLSSARRGYDARHAWLLTLEFLLRAYTHPRVLQVTLARANGPSGPAGLCCVFGCLSSGSYQCLVLLQTISDGIAARYSFLGR